VIDSLVTFSSQSSDSRTASSTLLNVDWVSSTRGTLSAPPFRDIVRELHRVLCSSSDCL